MDDRLTDLEIKVSYHEKTIADLDQVVRELGTQVELLKREVQTLRQGLRGMSEEALDPDEKPPHY